MHDALRLRGDRAEGRHSRADAARDLVDRPGQALGGLFHVIDEAHRLEAAAGLRAHLSLADEREHAVAFVVLERAEGESPLFPPA